MARCTFPTDAVNVLLLWERWGDAEYIHRYTYRLNTSDWFSQLIMPTELRIHIYV